MSDPYLLYLANKNMFTLKDYCSETSALYYEFLIREHAVYVCLCLSLFLISFFSSEDIHGLSLCPTSIVLRGIHSLATVSIRNLLSKAFIITVFAIPYNTFKTFT